MCGGEIPIEALLIQTFLIEAFPIEAFPIQTLPIQTFPIEALPIEILPIEAKPIGGAAALQALVDANVIDNLLRTGLCREWVQSRRCARAKVQIPLPMSSQRAKVATWAGLGRSLNDWVRWGMADVAGWFMGTCSSCPEQAGPRAGA